MRPFLLICAGVLLVVLEITVSPFAAVQGARPDLVCAFVVIVGMLLGWKDAAVVGLVVGFVEDACSGQFLGLFMLVRAVVGMGAGLSYAKVFHDRIVVPVAMVFLGAVATGLMESFLLSSFGVPLGFSLASSRMVLAQAVYSAVLAPVFPKLVTWLDLSARRASERRQAV